MTTKPEVHQKPDVAAEKCAVGKTTIAQPIGQDETPVPAPETLSKGGRASKTSNSRSAGGHQSTPRSRRRSTATGQMARSRSPISRPVEKEPETAMTTTTQGKAKCSEITKACVSFSLQNSATHGGQTRDRNWTQWLRIPK